MHHVSDLRSHIEDQEAKYAACLRFLEEHPGERPHWEPQLGQLRRELDTLHMQQMEYGRSAVNMSGHVEELAERMQQQPVRSHSPGRSGSPEAAAFSWPAAGAQSPEAAEIKAQVFSIMQGTKEAEREALAAKAAVESVRSHFVSTVTEFRAEVLHLKCSFESCMDTTRKALSGVTSEIRSSELSRRALGWNESPYGESEHGAQETLIEKMKAEVGQAMQELFGGLWESYSASLIRKQEEAHEKLTALVAHVIGEQVVSVSGAALAMALRKEVSAVRLENEQLQKQVAQTAAQLHTQIEDLELRAMLHDASRRPGDEQSSLAFEMQRSGYGAVGDSLGREVSTLRDEISSLHQKVERYVPEHSRLSEEVEVLRRSLANEKKMRGLTRLECDEVSDRVEERLHQATEMCSGCTALRREFEEIKQEALTRRNLSGTSMW